MVKRWGGGVGEEVRTSSSLKFIYHLKREKIMKRDEAEGGGDGGGGQF